MSKLSDQLRIHKTGYIKPERSPIKNYCIDSAQAVEERRESIEVVTEVTFRYGSFVTYDCNLDIEKTRHKRAIIHEVFGEFKSPIYEAMHAVRLGDERRALEVLEEMYENMFKV